MRPLRHLALGLLSFFSLFAPMHALPTLRAPMPAVLQTDVDKSGTVTCGDILRYTLTIEPQTEFGTDLQNVVFDIVPDTNILFGVLQRHQKHGMDSLPDHPVMQRWWAYMADIMRTNEKSEPVAIPLDCVFYMK